MGADRTKQKGPDWRRLERALGVKFKDKSLLRQAMVHPSYLNEQQNSELESYERLEYLGDAFLGWVIARELYRRFPEYNEGQLTRTRAALVRGRTLREIADELGLGAFLYLGQGEEAHGGRTRESNLAAAVEAVIGAAILDRGEKAASVLVLRLMGPRMERLETGGARPDAKSALQELLQGRGLPLPVYELVEQSGPPHDRRFTVRVEIGGRAMGHGVARRKGEAEQIAAAEAIEELTGSEKLAAR